MPTRRIRQHVNPLSSKFKQPIAIPDWDTVYARSELPWHFDIGCARGRFLLDMAQQEPSVNYLGIEIRQQLVGLANQDRDELELKNLHYLFGSINSSATAILESIPEDRLQTISVQFPDPWFKKKHNKRRVIQPDLVTVLVEHLAVGGKVFLQSDIKEVAEEMRDRFAADSRLSLQHELTWLEYNPFSVPTVREKHVLSQNLSVYRVLFGKS